MEDKTFDLLSKTYGEFTEFRKETNVRFEKIEGLIIRLENEHGKKLDALFDGYKQTYEKLETIEEKLDNHEVRI